MPRHSLPRAAAALLLLVASLALLAGCRAGEGVASSQEAPPPPRVETAVASPRQELVTRTYSGYLYPWEAHGIGFMLAGRVESIDVEVGDRVEKGQLLATLSSEDYRLVKELAAIQTAALQPNVERLQRLVDQNVLPRSDLDKLQGQYDAALTQYKQARRQLGYTKLESPVAGEVHERRTAQGQVVSPGMPVVVVLELDRLKAKFGISQAELPFFEVGTEYDLHIPGVEEARHATVTHIDYVSDPKTRTFDVSMEVDNHDRRLRPSMLAQLERVTERYDGIFVPLYAVEQTTGGPVVSVVDEATDTIVERLVTLGSNVGDQILIESGLSAGDRFVIVGQEFVRDGQKVAWK